MIVNNNSDYTYSQNKPLIEEYRNAFRLTDRDNVQIYTFPKGKAGKNAGSFIYKSMSLKALSLQTEVNKIKSKIKKLETSDTPYNEKSDLLNRLKIMKKYSESRLNAEISMLPRSGYIIIEEEE